MSFIAPVGPFMEQSGSTSAPMELDQSAPASAVSQPRQSVWTEPLSAAVSRSSGPASSVVSSAHLGGAVFNSVPQTSDDVVYKEFNQKMSVLTGSETRSVPPVHQGTVTWLSGIIMVFQIIYLMYERRSFRAYEKLGGLEKVKENPKAFFFAALISLGYKIRMMSASMDLESLPIRLTKEQIATGEVLQKKSGGKVKQSELASILTADQRLAAHNKLEEADQSQLSLPESYVKSVLHPNNYGSLEGLLAASEMSDFIQKLDVPVESQIKNRDSWQKVLTEPVEVLPTALRLWTQFVAKSSISRVVRLARSMQIPLPSTSKKCLLENGIAMIKIMHPKVVFCLVTVLLRMVPSQASELQADELQQWTVSNYRLLTATVEPFVTHIVTIAVFLFVVYFLYQFVKNLLKGVASCVKVVKREGLIWFQNRFGHPEPVVALSDEELDTANWIYEASKHYFRDVNGMSHCLYTSQVEPPFKTKSGPRLLQEQAIPGSPARVVKEMPRYLARVYVDDVFVGMAFRMRDFLVTAAHIGESIVKDSKITLATAKEKHSFTIKVTEKRDFKAYGSVILTPFPDIAVVPLPQSLFNLLDMTAVVPSRFVRGVRQQVSTVGTTSAKSEIEILHATGITEPAMNSGVVRYAATSFRGFSGSPVVVGPSILVDKPKVVAIHCGASNTDDLNQGFCLAWVDDWLNYKLSSIRKEDSPDYFRRMVEDNWDRLAEEYNDGRFYDDEDGNYWLDIGKKNLFRMTADEVEAFEDSKDYSEFLKKHKLLSEQEDDAALADYKATREERQAADAREEKEFYQKNNSLINDAMLGESAEPLAQPQVASVQTEAPITELSADDEEAQVSDSDSEEDVTPDGSVILESAYTDSIKKSIGDMDAKQQKLEGIVDNLTTKLTELISIMNSKASQPGLPAHQIAQEAKALAKDANLVNQVQNEIQSKKQKVEKTQSKKNKLLAQLKASEAAEAKAKAEKEALLAQIDEEDGFQKVKKKTPKNSPKSTPKNSKKKQVKQPEVSKESAVAAKKKVLKPKTAAKPQLDKKQVEKEIKEKLLAAEKVKALKEENKTLKLKSQPCPFNASACKGAACPYGHAQKETALPQPVFTQAGSAPPVVSQPSFLQALEKSLGCQNKGTGSQ